MRSLLLLLSFFGLLTASAQNGAEPSWKLLWGKKTLLKAAGEDEAANVVTIRRSDLRKKNTLLLQYVPAGNQKSGWNRTITVYGADDSELSRQKGNKLSLSAAALGRLARGRDELRIYTMAIPGDPRIAATVRVRRVHLVTIRIV